MSEAAARKEHRRSPRQRAYLGGKLVYGDYFSLDCVVRDINTGGAKVQLPEGQAVPDKVFLVDLKTAIAYDAHVVWRRYPLVGLAFDHRHGLAEAATPHLRILKQLWMAARERGSGIT
jgi:PilZ domain